jgi:twitching motility protein PilT
LSHSHEVEPLVLATKHHKSLADTPLRKFFEAAVKFEASDLILRSEQQPKVRLRGDLKSLDVPPIGVDDMENWIEEGLSPEQLAQYNKMGSLDTGMNLMVGEASHRFRLNLFRTRGRSAIAARRINNKILSLEQLYLPESIAKLAELHSGIILIAGVTGSGKSTTLAAILKLISETRPCHILTIEDPIEYLFTDGKAIVNQREIGVDVPSFPLALRAMVRENPDVVLIGEMRDRETFEAALHAAETGHLVFGTIHASSASQAFGRIYDLFPQEERGAIRTMLAFQMQAFIYQKLVPSIKEGVQRMAAVEILLQSSLTRKYIMDGKEHDLNTVIRESKEQGMQTFTDSLVDLVQKQYIHPRSAMAVASNPDELKMRLKGMIGS